MAASGFMLKLRSSAMPSMGPDHQPEGAEERLDVADHPGDISESSVVPGPPPNPGKWTRAGLPG